MRQLEFWVSLHGHFTLFAAHIGDKRVVGRGKELRSTTAIA
jgi:hypothetical protein